MSKVRYITIHCSAAKSGTARLIDEDHRTKRMWKCIGYHYVILNGCPFNDKYMSFLDGQLETGRKFDGDEDITFDEVGAHTVGYNSNGIGICLVGLKGFTDKQLEKMKEVVTRFMTKFSIPIENVIGHYETGVNKTCPNMPMNSVREYLTDKITLGDLQIKIKEHIIGIYGEDK